MSKQIKPNTTLTARSVCDNDCVFSIKVLSRTAKTANIVDQFGREKRTKIHTRDGVEFVQPQKYSMAPVFSA